MMSEQEKRQEQAEWPLADAQRSTPKKDAWINRFSGWIHQHLVKGLSNLRLSLTLRIALHYAGQLLKTSLLMLLVFVIAFCAALAPEVNRALDELTLMKPMEGTYYAQSQLEGLPFERAWLLEKTLGNGVNGLTEKARLMFSSYEQEGQYRLIFYADSQMGGLAAAYEITQQRHLLLVLCIVLLVFECYRVVYFLCHRNRLNRKVLKPITDMAEKAATLSANNLSDRISVEGAKNELKDLALVINGMLDRIELSYNSQKQFVSDASHELRTPIAVIQGYISMLERWGKTDKEVLDEGIAAISQEAASMKELVERLLFLARHDKKTLMLEVEEFNPLEIMSEIHREAKMLSADHNFKLDPSQNVSISGDKDMIKQLMRILLDNAIKYTPPGGNITLGVKKEGRYCLLSVSDTGAGIAAEELPKVFERFYRCDEARKAQSSGHGLGLSIARIIVSAHNGKLKVRSKVGVGTTFMVLLPLENE